MLPNMFELFRRSAFIAVMVSAALLASAPPIQARVTRIIIDTTVSPAYLAGDSGVAIVSRKTEQLSLQER
jgi:hypothetical protein